MRVRGKHDQAAGRQQSYTPVDEFGVVALDALSDPGRALLTAPDRLVAALRATLPAPIDHVLLQADLTAVAPGPLEAGLARELDLAADVESAGGATVYRFSEPSIRRALDAGRSATDLHHLFATRSATPSRVSRAISRSACRTA